MVFEVSGRSWFFVSISWLMMVNGVFIEVPMGQYSPQPG